MEIWIALSIILGIAAIGMILSGAAKKCPSCSKWWAGKRLSREKIDSKTGYKTVIRTDEQKNAKGEVTGTVQRREQVHVITDTYETTWGCKYCGHVWKTTSSNTYEG